MMDLGMTYGSYNPETVTWDFDEAFEFVLNTVITKIP